MDGVKVHAGLLGGHVCLAVTPPGRGALTLAWLSPERALALAERLRGLAAGARAARAAAADEPVVVADEGGVRS
jgi:hypothetical protein